MLLNHPPELILETLNKMNKNTLMQTLDIEYTEVTEDYIIARMPVTPKVHQVMGLLHGGASIALAETIGSLFSALHVDVEKFNVLGLQLSANHLKPISSGFVYAKAEFIREGRTTHLVQIQLYDEQQNNTCIVSLTNYIQEKNRG